MEQNVKEYLKSIVSNLPEGPGCYQYLDENGMIIYVGKAKNLKRRVSSYFRSDVNSAKTKVLVSKIRDIRYVVVKTETDALLLENSLIKQYKPRYNVLLKDDKTYPSIAITNEYLPRIFPTRIRSLRGAQYYGPYSHVGTMHALLDLCKKMYHPRPCRTLMSQEGVKQNKYRVCLDYHIRKCLGPCVGKQTREEYIENIDRCREILKGNIGEIVHDLKLEMAHAAEILDFEKAQDCKVKLELLAGFQAKSEIVSSTLHNIDVFNIENDGNHAYINYLHVVNGIVNQAFTFEYKKKLNESEKELLAMGIVEMRDRYGSQSHEIIVPFPVDLPENYAEQTVPIKGDKKKLLELSYQNVKQYRLDRLKHAEKLNPEQKSVRLMTEIKDLLGLERLPFHVELFDNSNISGEDAVAACVVFEKLKPAKKLYRRYNIKTVVGPDDYASMHEVVLRRYSRMKEEGTPLPDLIIADGGQGQMEVIRKAVEDELELKIPIAGLAKDNRHRTKEFLVGFPPKSIGFSSESTLFQLLTRMQDEVHRFAISFHRDKRSKRQLKSELDDIKGLGPVTRDTLLKHFKSVKRTLEASESEIRALLGEKKGEKIYLALHEKRN